VPLFTTDGGSEVPLRLWGECPSLGLLVMSGSDPSAGFFEAVVCATKGSSKKADRCG